MDDLKLEHLYIVYPGKKTHPVDRLITALFLSDTPSLFQKVKGG